MFYVFIKTTGWNCRNPSGDLYFGTRKTWMSLFARNWVQGCSCWFHFSGRCAYDQGVPPEELTICASFHPPSSLFLTPTNKQTNKKDLQAPLHRTNICFSQKRRFSLLSNQKFTVRSVACKTALPWAVQKPGVLLLDCLAVVQMSLVLIFVLGLSLISWKGP